MKRAGNLRIRHFIAGVFISLALFSASLTFHSCHKAHIYKDPKAAIEDRVEDLLSQMTLDEKLELLAGVGESGMDTKENTRLGIPAFKMSDGPLGVRWDQSTAYPCGAAMAATWDTALIGKVAEALAVETHAKGRNFLLGPCVNIHRLPTGGRNFESFGEDPWLTSRMAVSYVKGLQSQHVIPCVKHFALNNQEWRRTEVDVKADARAMREIYLPSFEAAVKEAGAWAVMSAYNKVNGWWCSENQALLTDILKKEWGFNGIVVSDWVSTHSTEYAANHGLDIEMPTGVVYSAEKLKQALKDGKIDEKTIDDKVRRILRVKFLAGLFDETITPDTSVFFSETKKELVRKVSEESVVLLKNNRSILPLDLKKVKKIAVIGPNAGIARTGGGGSSRISPYYAVSPLEGIKKYAGTEAEVIYSPGCELANTPLESVPGKYFSLAENGKPGLKGEYFKNMKLQGTPALVRTDTELGFLWDDKAPDPVIGNDHYSVRWTGRITPPVTRVYTFYAAGDDGVRLFIDGKKVVDNWTDHGITVDTARVEMVAGKACDIRVEYYENEGGSEFILGWDLPEKEDKAALMIADAVKAAKEGTVAIVFAGSTEFIESEGFDRREEMVLGGKQDELIKAVAAANPNTIVVLNTGTPVITHEWLDKIPALVETFFAGQEGGNAIADVLFGKTNPSGKLPFSFISSPEQSPAYRGYMNPGLDAPYTESILVGYRYLEKHNINPVFPFGHGLSYTTFEYSGMEATPFTNGKCAVTINVKNTGKTAGKEVVQLYVSEKNSKVLRPVKELKGFVKVQLEPGETKAVTFLLNTRSFSYYDAESGSWKADPGNYELLAGSSSADIRQKINYEIR